MKLTQRNINSIKIFGFLLMIGLMVVLNNQQEDARSKTGKQKNPDLIKNNYDLGITPASATIPNKTEGALPLRLISKTNSNFLLVINNCQHYAHAVKFQLLQKNYLKICTMINYNFITEYLATIRNKDYK